MIKLALTDIDDTLISYGRPCASRHALDAIAAMYAAGLRVGPASGRVPWDLDRLFDGDREAYKTATLINGQLGYIDGKLAWEIALPSEELARIGALLGAYKGACLMIDDYGDRFAVGITAAEIQEFHGRFDRIGSVKKEVPNKKIIKANVHVASMDMLDDVRNLLASSTDAFDFVYPNPHAPLIDILPHGWGKHRGVERLRQELGVAPDELVAFGDAENDLSVLRSVYHSVSVANAAPEVARVCRWHIGASADDAVADALFDIARAAATQAMPAFMGEKNLNPDAVYEPLARA
ncbi:MAG: HAD family hydrolase [Atopobiaceae bacterium]